MQCWEKGPAVARMQRELLYECSNGRAMGNNAKDVGRGGLASAQVPVLYNQSDAQ